MYATIKAGLAQEPETEKANTALATGEDISQQLGRHTAQKPVMEIVAYRGVAQMADAAGLSLAL